MRNSGIDMAATTCTNHNESTLNVEKIEKPHVILLFSGKRKSGKDYITDILHNRLGSTKSVVIKISGPIKSHWAETLNLDVNKLMGDGEYKEIYRSAMIKWSEGIRRSNYGYFCHAAINMYKANGKLIWIVSDVRRKTDIKWFKENFGKSCKTIRIICNEETRKSRGWVFTSGKFLNMAEQIYSELINCVDDAESECNLDDFSEWDLQINNDNNTMEDILKSINNLINL